MTEARLEAKLHEHPLRQQLITHRFFDRVKTEPLDRDQVAVFLGQWWHPLHYFTTFLADCVAAIPDIATKSAITKILYQESGEGVPEQAHEVIYADTMEQVGFSRHESTGQAPFEETRLLVALYERTSKERFAALGSIFATEVADLAMVSGIGDAVRRVTGAEELEWVDIHVAQEPDHVQEADNSLDTGFSPDEEARIMESAQAMWSHWIAFFDRLDAEVFEGGDTRARAAVA